MWKLLLKRDFIIAKKVGDQLIIVLTKSPIVSRISLLGR